MTNLTPSPALSEVIQLETTTLALAGPGNPMNQQAQALLNRDAYRGQQIQSLIDDFSSAEILQYVDGTPLEVMNAGQVVMRGTQRYWAVLPATFPLSLSGIWLMDQALLVGVTGKVVRSPLDFGAVLDGVTDDGPAIRLALDAMPENGGILDFPDGSRCKIVGTIFIPQRNPVSGVAGMGIWIHGNNSQIFGDGASTVFESGTGRYSTVALGGASNFPQPDESAAAIHYNSQISGFTIQNCLHGIRVKNWLHGCIADRLYFTNFTGMAFEADRSFYLSATNWQGRPLRSDRADSMPIFRFNGANNTQTIHNVHASGITPLGTSSGICFELDGGVQGLELPGGISFEGGKAGIVLKSVIYSLNIGTVYFELCDVAIKSVGANIFNMNVTTCEFEDCLVDVDVDGWEEGTFGSGNKTEAPVKFGNGCTNKVAYPRQALTELTQGGWVGKPSGWVVPAGCGVIRDDLVFNSAVGFNGLIFRNQADSSGGNGIVPKAFTGDSFNFPGKFPFCGPVTGIGGGSGTLVVDTNIAWNPNLSAVRFDIYVTHTPGNAVIAGRLSALNTVFRDDVTAFTVTTSDNGSGRLRFTFGGFTNITDAGGQIRII